MEKKNPAAEPVDVRGRWFLQRVCGVFGRNPLRPLGYDGQQALPGILEAARETLEQELKVVEWFYGLPEDEEALELRSRRNSLEKLLANWSEEVDRARGYAKKIGAAAIEAPAKKIRRPEEPEGWRDAVRELSDDPDRCVIPDRFADLPRDVQRDVLRILEVKKETAEV